LLHTVYYIRPWRIYLVVPNQFDKQVTLINHMMCNTKYLIVFQTRNSIFPR